MLHLRVVSNHQDVVLTNLRHMRRVAIGNNATTINEGRRSVGMLRNRKAKEHIFNGLSRVAAVNQLGTCQFTHTRSVGVGERSPNTIVNVMSYTRSIVGFHVDDKLTRSMYSHVIP